MISSKKNLDNHKKLILYGQNYTDLKIISALVQDSLLKTTSVRWIKKRHRFSMLINRFRWELVPEKKSTSVPFQRVRSMLIFDDVLSVSHRGLENALENEVLSLLSLNLRNFEKYEEIDLIFSGKTDIKLKVEVVSIRLQDFGLNDLSLGVALPNHEV